MNPPVPVEGTSGKRQLAEAIGVSDVEAVDVEVAVAAVRVPDGVALGVVNTLARLAPQLATRGITSRVSNRVLTSGTVEHPHDRPR
jgi:hypothetical protein